jgi:hypothetical protein
MADKLGITEDVFVEVSEFRGEPRVDIRKWYDNKGEMARGKNGLNIDASTWEDIVARWEDIKQYVETELKRFKK